MNTDWAQTQHKSCLVHPYSGDSVGLPNESVLSQLVGVLDYLISHKYSPKDSAARTASLIISQEDVETSWSNLVGTYLDAAENFADEKELSALVDYIVELTSLPGAVNAGPGIKTLEVEGKTVRIEQGQAVVFEAGKLWRDLPSFSWNLTESFQGPERYLFASHFPASPDAAKVAWRNLNTYIALIAKSPDAH